MDGDPFITSLLLSKASVEFAELVTKPQPTLAHCKEQYQRIRKRALFTRTPRKLQALSSQLR